MRRRAIKLHIVLADFAAVFHGLDAFAQVVRRDRTRFDAGGGGEEDARAGDKGGEHRAGDDGLDGCDAVVSSVPVVRVGMLKGALTSRLVYPDRIYQLSWFSSYTGEDVKKTHHLRGSDKPTLQHKTRLCAEKRRFPNHQIRQSAHLDTAHDMADPLRNGRVNRILTHIPLNPMIIRPLGLVLRQPTPQNLIDVRHVPRPRHHLTTPPHGLRVRGHHANRPQIVQHVLGTYGLGSNPRLGERDVLRDVFRQVVARHGHVEVLFHRVGGVRAGRVGAAGEDVGFLDQGDEVGRVPAAGAFDVVGVDCPSFESRRGAFDEAGFVQGVAV